MLVRPHAPSKTGTLQAAGKRAAAHQDKHTPKTATAAADPRRTTTAGQETHHREAAAAAQSHRLVPEDRERHWAYQQDPNIGERFPGNAE
jgi:hypothetical protein